MSHNDHAVLQGSILTGRRGQIDGESLPQAHTGGLTLTRSIVGLMLPSRTGGLMFTSRTGGLMFTSGTGN